MLKYDFVLSESGLVVLCSSEDGHLPWGAISHDEATGSGRILFVSRWQVAIGALLL